jgi:hypothetical protein
MSERRAVKEAQKLYDSVKPVDRTELTKRIYYELGSRGISVPDYFVRTFSRYCLHVAAYDHWSETPPEPPNRLDSIDGARYRDLLRRLQARTFDDLQRVVRVMAKCAAEVAKHLHGGMFSVPLSSLVEPQALVESVIAPFLDDGKEVFPNLARTLTENVKEVGAWPEDYQGKDACYHYLKNTPLFEFVNIRIPFGIPFDTYFEHMHVLGGSGAGKTSYLAQLARELIGHKERPAIIIIDSQGSFIPQVRTLAAIQDRLTYIDPKNPPTINLFEGGAAFDTYKYLFSSILDMELTGKQETFFKFVISLLQQVPQATIQDLIDVTIDTKKYTLYIERLSAPHQQFFFDDYDRSYKDTRGQVRTRLQGIVADHTLGRLLSGTTTTLDLQSILKGGVLLVDTSKDALGGVSGAFGRVFIFLIMKAVYGRADRHPVLLLIDEVQEYFSSTIDDMLNQMRKFRCGCVFAHQNLGQAKPELRASLASSTSVKMASQVSLPDARVMAGEMHTTPEFITEQPRLHFALYARGITKHAVSVAVTPGILDREPHVPLPARRTSEPEPDYPETPPKATTAPTAPQVQAPTPHDPDEIDTAASESW